MSAPLIQLMPETHPKENMRLGRHHFLDSRSIAYTASRRHPRRKVVPVAHPCPPDFPILDQGNLGSCTGNAATAALVALYFQHLRDWKGLRLDGLTMSVDAIPDEQFAVETYHDETLIDGFGAPWPDNDRGSCGLAACKVLKTAGLVGGYTWATTLAEFAQLMMNDGVIVGMPWYESFFTPNSEGFIDDGDYVGSGLAGGHELYFDRLLSWDPTDPSKSVVGFRQSWGPGWGLEGYGRMRMSTYVNLRSQMDVKQFQLGPMPGPSDGPMTTSEYDAVERQNAAIVEALKLVNQGLMTGAGGLAGKIVEIQGGQPLDYSPIPDFG